MIIIENHAFPSNPKSNAPSEQDRHEEDLGINALDTLEMIRRHQIPAHFIENRGIDGPAAWLMFVLRPVANHYGVDKDDLLDAWAGHYGLGLAEEGDTA